MIKQWDDDGILEEEELTEKSEILKWACGPERTETEDEEFIIRELNYFRKK